MDNVKRNTLFKTPGRVPLKIFFVSVPCCA